jgi:hypothetical protein
MENMVLIQNLNVIIYYAQVYPQIKETKIRKIRGLLLELIWTMI